MRVFYGPVGAIVQAVGNAVGGLLGGGQKSGGDTYITNGPSANDQFAKEQAAADEAARKERIAAQTRAGARSNILADPNLAQTFGSNPVARKNLLGNG